MECESLECAARKVAARLFRSLSLCFCFAWKHGKRENREEIVSLGSMVKEKTERRKRLGFTFTERKILLTAVRTWRNL
jgi:hypothetical protein